MKPEYDKETGITWAKPDCVDDCLHMIWGIGYDYDGYNRAEDLKDIIDELVDLAKQARVFLRDGKFFSDNTPSEEYNSAGHRIVAHDFDCADCLCRVCARNTNNDMIADVDFTCEACASCKIGKELIETDDDCKNFVSENDVNEDN